MVLGIITKRSFSKGTIHDKLQRQAADSGGMRVQIYATHLSSSLDKSPLKLVGILMSSKSLGAIECSLTVVAIEETMRNPCGRWVATGKREFQR